MYLECFLVEVLLIIDCRLYLKGYIVGLFYSSTYLEYFVVKVLTINDFVKFLEVVVCWFVSF